MIFGSLNHESGSLYFAVQQHRKSALYTIRWAYNCSVRELWHRNILQDTIV